CFHVLGLIGSRLVRGVLSASLRVPVLAWTLVRSSFLCDAKESNANHAEEALRHAKFKFPGRQKIIRSRKWGFTKFVRAEYLKYKSEGRIAPDGVNAT
ncbi:hypothetical protein ACJX0J_017909, partial [Zea mays]